jgi:hypothetical protein
MRGEEELPAKQNDLINASECSADLNFEDGEADMVDAPVDDKARVMDSPEKRPSRMFKVDADELTKKSKSKKKEPKKRSAVEGLPDVSNV